MLIAPAGYGKTTLAEQWVARDGRVGIWYTARSASTDVAALALGIARSATAIVAGCDHRLREHLRALPAPAENVETLAEILSEDLDRWPPNAWLVIDDYQEIAQEQFAEDFIEALAALSRIQFLLASRVRPRWVPLKSVLYGDVLELNQAALAMNSAEASEVLADRSAQAATGLASLAQGWPAVIGLASASSVDVGPDAEHVPESLYRFFADEVFGALDADVQRGLATLSIAPVLERELAKVLLGARDAEVVCTTATDIGLFVERGARLELHPLARSFLEERSRQDDTGPTDAAGVCLNFYLERKEWDAAFDLITRAGLSNELVGLIALALDDLIGTARLTTLERWFGLATAADLDVPIASLAQAEVLLRRGRHVEATARAERAATDPDIAFRALSVAGRAAHLASREEIALSLYERAEQAAHLEAEVRDARWGKLACAIDLELPDAAAALDDLSVGVSLGDVREIVRMATHGILLQLRTAKLNLDEADTANQLLAAADDPMVETSFLSGYAIALALASRYDDAEVAADRLLAMAERYRLDFALPYALCASAMACAGRRRWADAERAALDALRRATTLLDIHAELLSRSVLLRLYSQQGSLPDALEIGVVVPQAAPSAAVSEAYCSRALALACAGRLDDARELINAVRGTSRAIEPVVLTPAVETVCAIRSNSPDAFERAADFAGVAFATGGVDLLVTTYRACPEILGVLLRGSDSSAFRALVERVGDGDLAAASGYPIATNDDRRLLLSPREREVFELLRNGFTNRQIAKLLYIEQSTVKVHAHHIYDKLGVRSRSALTVQAALERAGQATSAIETSLGEGSSEL